MPALDQQTEPGRLTFSRGSSWFAVTSCAAGWQSALILRLTSPSADLNPELALLGTSKGPFTDSHPSVRLGSVAPA